MRGAISMLAVCVVSSVQVEAQTVRSGPAFLLNGQEHPSERTTRFHGVSLVDVEPRPARIEVQAIRQTGSARSRMRRGGGMLFGAALGLAAHEAGHVAANALYGSDMFVKKVDTVGIPFFAIAHRKQLLPRQEVVVASAGLWVQSALSEWVLTRAPRLRHRSAPIRKGVIGFHAVTSALYGVAGLAGVGPMERDTRGMAARGAISERWIGVAVLAPGLLDTYRYYRPSSTWAKWASRIAKVMMVAPLVVR